MNLMHPIQRLAQGTFIALSIAALAAPALAVTPVQGQSSEATARATPLGLRSALYRALARDPGSAYAVNADGCAVLPKSGLKACFDAQGAHFSGIGSPLALHLVGYGRGTAVSPVQPVRPVTQGNRVGYRHGNLTEWWRVLPVGFEQGFTLTRKPAGDGALTLALATNGRTAGDQAKQGAGTLVWGQLRYGRLVVTDANGKIIPAKFESKGKRILIAVNDTHAAYPLTVDPLVWIEQKVSAADGAESDEFGYSVAVAGSTAFVGVPNATVNGNSYEGAVYVFTDSDGTWTQTQKLDGNGGAGDDQFGWSIAMEGTTALVGAVGATINGNVAQGAVYAFTDEDGIWTQTAKFSASDGAAYESFGWAVALSGGTAMVGMPYADINGINWQGAGYVFTDSDGTWTQTQKLVASDGVEGDEFGSHVALSGSTAVFGVNDANLVEGAAYVFTESNDSWTQAQKLAASDGAAGDQFGWAVALAGADILIGAPYATLGANTNQGAVYVFAGTDGNWTQTQKITADDGGYGGLFGSAIAVSGTTAFIGAEGAIVNGNFQQGEAYAFDDSGGTWTQTQEFIASDGAPHDQFGWAVAASGETALVGAYAATINGNDYQGAAYFYGGSDLGVSVSAPQTVGQGHNYVSQTIATNNASTASPAVSATIAVPAAASFVSATATQGSCGEASGLVTCAFGAIDGNAGTATANVTLKATGNVGDTIENVSGIAKAEPPLSASAPTTITAGGACPGGYSKYDGSLNAGKRTHSPIYQAPAGVENAILTGPSGFQLYVVFRNAQGRKVFRIPGNEVHRQAPAGTFTWVVQAGHAGGAFTLCVLHP